MDKISIIVPIYNGARFLDRIVPALLDQTYQNTEIILVNDGSTDDTAAVCAAYAEKYPAGISFVDAPHGGVSCARNHGLDHASGDWIYFCDADDASVVAAHTDYGYAFVSAVVSDNIAAIQFHPEKSQDIGEQILRNFARMADIPTEAP